MGTELLLMLECNQGMWVTYWCLTLNFASQTAYTHNDTHAHSTDLTTDRRKGKGEMAYTIKRQRQLKKQRQKKRKQGSNRIDKRRYYRVNIIKHVKNMYGSYFINKTFYFA